MRRVLAGAAIAASLAVLMQAPFAAAELQDEMVVLGFWQRWTRIYTVAQTPDGYVWIATNTGLVRYDGVRFVTYARGRELALPVNDVRALAVGRDGSLFIGLDDGGGLWRIYRGELTALAIGPDLATESIRALAEAPDGTLWIGTAGGLKRLSGGHLEGLRATPGQPAGPIVSLAVNRDGRLFVGTSAGLSIYDRGSFRAVEGTAPAVSLAPDGAGGVFVARDDEGVARVDAGGVVTTLAPVEGGPALKGSHAVRLLPDGTLMVGFTRGIAHLREERWEVVNTLGTVDQIVPDHEGSLWLGRNGGGLRRVGRRRLRVVGADQATDVSSYAVLAARDGRVYVALNRRLLEVGPEETRSWSRDEGLKATQIRSLAGGRNGSVWIGTLDAGLFRLQGDTISALTPEQGLPETRIQALHEDRAGLLWIAGRFGGLQTYDGTTFRAVPFPLPPCPAYAAPADCNAQVTSFADDPRGGLWVGTRKAGLVHLDGGAAGFRHYGRAEGLPAERIMCLFVDRDDVLWIGTEGAGLVRFQNGRFSSLGLEGGLPLPNVFGIVEDRAGNLWMGAETGIFRAKKRDIHGYMAGQLARVEIVSYDTADGMVQTRVSQTFPPVAARARDGTIWFATSHGAVVLTPPDREAPVPPPRVLVEEVKLDGKPLRLASTASLEMPAGRGTLELRYTAPSFVAPHRIRFRYRLEGYDTDWMDAQDRRVAFYSNLPPGTYAFQVRAALDDLDWGRAEASLPFRVLSFYQRPPFWGALALGLLALGWLGHQVRLRYLRSRFSVVLDERNRIARDLHDSLAQYLSGIGFQLERLAQQIKDGPDKAREILKDTKQMVMRCRLEARQTIWNLRAHDLEGRALGDAIGELSKQLRLSGSAEVSVRVSGRERRLSVPVQAELMRIVQEASANALVHGQAAHVIVALNYGEEELTLRVEDDGVGFAPDEATGGGLHFGLVGMRERAERAGGRFRVDSQPGQGATVEVVVPLGAAAAARTPAPAREPEPERQPDPEYQPEPASATRSGGAGS